MRLLMRSRADRPFAVAAAVAHEINEDLSIILNGIYRCSDQLIPEDPLQRELLDMRAAAKRCAWRNAQLLNYSGTQGVLGGPCSIDRLVKEE